MSQHDEYIDDLEHWGKANPTILPSQVVAVYDDDIFYQHRQFHGYARVIATEFDHGEMRWYADVKFKNGIKVHLPCAFMKPVSFKVNRHLMRLVK